MCIFTVRGLACRLCSKDPTHIWGLTNFQLCGFVLPSFFTSTSCVIVVAVFAL